MLEKTTKIKGALRSPAYQEVLDVTKKVDQKTKNRYAIQEGVFDDLDSIADNAKMVSLIMSMFYRLYEAMPQEVFDNLTVEDKGAIEYAIGVFKATRTRADDLFDSEGTEFVDRMFVRQGQVGQILRDTE